MAHSPAAWKSGLKGVLPKWCLAAARSLRRLHWVSAKQELFWPQVTFFNDGLATIHDCSFLDHPRFQRAYQLGAATGSWRGTQNQWRVHTQCWAADIAKKLPGDFVECGVYRGGSARAVVDFIDFPSLSKRYFLVDTYEGIPEKAQTGKAVQDPYEPTYEAVCRTFAKFPAVKIVRGAVPEVLPQVDAKQIAFLHLDMNVAGPEVAAAETFWDHLVPGAPVLLDDYAYRGYREQREAFDAFAERHRLTILTLPTGQGLFFR